MAKIRLLDQGTVNKIAAGEVVERPASVVKEMVENSIDAGATKVTVEIRGGGISMIRISDNGCGIDKEEVRTAFLRHSTSKIRKVEDLLNTTSLGFRGEALASIAAVARVEMMTKTKEEKTGIRFVIEGGEERVFEEVACPVGTTLIVENLFFNTPPRRKFLKRETAEAAAVTDLMQKLTLAHPEVSFRYLNGKKEPTIYSAGNGNLKNSIYAVYGRDIVDKLIPVEGEILLTENREEANALVSYVEQGKRMQVKGFVSRPQLTKTNRSFETFFINGRYIRSALLEKAVDEAFKDFIVPGTFPVAVLHLTMDPSTLDVNVHPTKMEIRFNAEDAVRKGLYEVLVQAMKEENLIARVGDFYKPEEEKEIIVQPAAVRPSFVESEQDDFRKPFLPKTPPKGARLTTDYKTKWRSDIDPQKVPGIPKDFTFTEEPSAPEPSVAESEPSVAAAAYFAPKPYERPISKAFIVEETPPIATPYGGDQIEVQSGEGEPAFPQPETELATESAQKELPHHLRLIGQIFKTYWIAEEGDVFYIIDQHAAHERVLYDRYRAMLSQGNITSQMLMEPVVATAAPKAVAELDSYQPILQQLGYRVEAFGDDAVVVRGVPFLFNKALPAEDIALMMDMLYDGQMDTARDLLIDKIAMMSCKAAVKGNDPMSFMEANSLLEQLFASPNPYNCPHGRPTILSVTEYQLEKRFKRV